MSAPILATKLYIPPPRAKIVLRPHLIEHVNDGLQRKLILISAPAGFGKTTLLSEWVASREHLEPKVRVAWLSLDEGDNDLVRFLTYLIVAFQTVVPDIAAGALEALQSPQQPSTESILTALLNEFSTLPDRIFLILDDYHVIDAKPIDQALSFLLEHLPPQLHLILATRQDPQLPLPRYRARGQLTELRVADLRFTPAEAAEFLNKVMGLNLSAEDTAALEARTEGWIAGLQLAALSMQGLQDIAGFIQSFTGSHHFVLDYLIEEVLHKQPESVQRFLLSTSFIDRLCGSLCDTVLHDVSAPGEETAGQETLEYLERANLFIVPLDNERRWYRYHLLFAELLRNRLARSYPGQILHLHRRASDWYAHNDLPDQAIRHALAIQDWSRAAEIIERHSDEWPMYGEISTVLGWLETFPARIMLDRPGLGLVYAWTLFMANYFDRAEQLLNQLMPLIQTTPFLLGELFVIRVMIAANRYDMPAFIELAQQALSVLPSEEASPRSRILLSLGLAYYDMGGDIVAARSAFREAFELGKALAPSSSVGGAPLPLTALAYLSEIEWIQGSLHDASLMYEEALKLAERWGGGSSIALCLVQTGRASLLCEWNDLDEAVSALKESIRIGELWRNPYLLVPAYGLSAIVMQKRGQVNDAREMISRAEQVTRDSFSSPLILGFLARYQIALWTAQNDFQAITHWEQAHDLDWQSQIGRARDALTVVLASSRIARYYRLHDDAAPGEARALIQPALEQAQASGLVYHVARLLMLDAVALYAQGQTASSITVLGRALALAEPENYVRSFLDLGKPMEELLSRSLESESLHEPHLRRYVGKLFSLFGADFPIKSSQPTAGTLSEPLTERELQVLRLIARGLSNDEIGKRLYLALDTVKGHNRNIFAKLQVHRRTEAIARARELGLV